MVCRLSQRSKYVFNIPLQMVVWPRICAHADVVLHVDLHPRERQDIRVTVLNPGIQGLRMLQKSLHFRQCRADLFSNSPWTADIDRHLERRCRLGTTLYHGASLNHGFRPRSGNIAQGLQLRCSLDIQDRKPVAMVRE